MSKKKEAAKEWFKKLKEEYERKAKWAKIEKQYWLK